MSNYGLYISDGVIPIVNNDAPLLIVGDTVQSSMVQTTGSVYLQKYTSPSINTNYAPLMVTNCQSGYVRAVAQTGNDYYIQSQSASSILTKVLTTSKYNPLPLDKYGIASYNANGELVFSSSQKYPKITSIVPYDVNAITNMAINAARGSFSPVSISHSHTNTPMYSLGSINQTYFYYKGWYTGTALGYNYQSVGYIINIGLRQDSNTSCSLATIANYYNVSQALNDPIAGYAAGLYVRNTIDNFGTAALDLVLYVSTISSDEYMYRFVGNTATGLLYVVEQ